TIMTAETKRVDEITSYLREKGFPALCIHGDKAQPERNWVLDEFRNGRSPILVATDVAARGLDVDDVKFVINVDFPNCSEDYIHRIGRTARSNNTGTAYTFFTFGNRNQAKELVDVLKEAKQIVNPQLMELVGKSKSFGNGRGRRWGGRNFESARKFAGKGNGNSYDHRNGGNGYANGGNKFGRDNSDKHSGFKSNNSHDGSAKYGRHRYVKNQYDEGYGQDYATSAAAYEGFNLRNGVSEIGGHHSGEKAQRPHQYGEEHTHSYTSSSVTYGAVNPRGSTSKFGGHHDGLKANRFQSSGENSCKWSENRSGKDYENSTFKDQNLYDYDLAAVVPKSFTAPPPNAAYHSDTNNYASAGRAGVMDHYY
ncbi:probable ATP-dependent RNA helicase DDX17, partial [Nephila pilipes]